MWYVSRFQYPLLADIGQFLRFFGFAIKFLTIAFAFALVIILPVHFKFTGKTGLQPGNGTAEADFFPYAYRLQHGFYDDMELLGKKEETKPDTGYLWMYVAFVYLFTGLAIYLLVQETIKIIGVRQMILGSQSTVTDRTIRLSGIPPELRSEEKIQNFIEELEIGKVDSVMLCRDWGELDELMAKRMRCLRRLEESWTLHLGHRRKPSTSVPIVEPRDQDDEEAGLLSGFDDSQAHVSSYERDRPTTKLRFGFLNLQSRKIDAIDYYEEKLRNLDEKIKEARKKEYKPTPLAFVTMDSTAACQMAIQAILSPTPMQLLAGRAPAPADIVWKNTYLPRGNRMARAWMITIIIGLLTILWTFVLVPLAGLLNEDAIKKVWPGLVSFLEQHPIGKSLVQTGLPTLALSLLTVAVPYIYDCKYETLLFEQY
jgi:calcium permeable stress-gated cation channel